MRALIYCMLLGCSLGLWAQTSSSPQSAPPANQPANTSSAKEKTPDAPSAAAKSANTSNPSPSDVNANSIPVGSSSSKDEPADISPPANDARAHPHSGQATLDAEMADNPDPTAAHPWNPHKAAKDIEVGDFYFKQKNYRAAMDRYREALYYKDNDASATFHLAQCFDRLGEPVEARAAYERYLQILPYGSQAKDAHKAIARLDSSQASAKSAK